MARWHYSHHLSSSNLKGSCEPPACLCMMKTADLAHGKLSFIPLVGSHRLVFRVIVGEVLRQELPRFGGVSGIDWRSIKTKLAPAASCWWASHRSRSAGRWRRGSQSKCMISPRHDSRHPFQKLAAPYTSRVMSPPHSPPPPNKPRLDGGTPCPVHWLAQRIKERSQNGRWAHKSAKKSVKKVVTESLSRSKRKPRATQSLPLSVSFSSLLLCFLFCRF